MSQAEAREREGLFDAAGRKIKATGETADKSQVGCPGSRKRTRCSFYVALGSMYCLPGTVSSWSLFWMIQSKVLWGIVNACPPVCSKPTDVWQTLLSRAVTTLLAQAASVSPGFSVVAPPTVCLPSSNSFSGGARDLFKEILFLSNFALSFNYIENNTHFPYRAQKLWSLTYASNFISHCLPPLFHPLSFNHTGPFFVFQTFTLNFALPVPGALPCFLFFFYHLDVSSNVVHFFKCVSRAFSPKQCILTS